jgi:crossover junction endodeoxyribonuclease RusA
MTIDLPWPPSSNHAYRNLPGKGRAKTKAAREYTASVVDLTRVTPGRRPRRSDRVRVTITAYPPDRRKRDLANLEKLAVDAVMTALGLDDSQIDQLQLVRREPSATPALVLQLEVLA